MKVLLYEPGEAGHRLVVLNYVKRIFDSAGIQSIHVAESYDRCPWRLALFAKEQQCDCLFYLMIDGRALHAAIASTVGNWLGIQTIAIYYLYNNLIEFPRSWAWRMVIATGRISAILISDNECLSCRSGYPSVSRYLPDPWDPDEFPIFRRSAARERLGIVQSDVVFTMFGELDGRKGADIFIDAAERFIECNPEASVTFVLAGRQKENVTLKISESRKRIGSRLREWNFRIEEADVSTFFCASDYIVCPYPRYFKVSSGTVTRALAAGVRLITSDHGVTGRLVRKNGLGLVVPAGDAEALSIAFSAAVKQAACSESSIRRMKELSSERTLTSYRGFLLSAIRSIVSPSVI